jgi:hypothetical protein
LIRGLRPTDAFAYAAFRRRSPVNAALARPDGCNSPLTVRDFFGGVLALDPRRRRWIHVVSGQIRGLAVVSFRFGADVWDVERLFLASSPDVARVGADLLNHVCASAIEDGVQKVFLRLPEDSEAVPVAHQAGFAAYCSELVLRRRTADQVATSVVPGLRARRRSDHLGLFRLFCAVAPAFVRQAEGMTLQEWRSTDGWWAPPVDWRLPDRTDKVLPGADGIRVWVSTDNYARVLRVVSACDDAGLAWAAIASELARRGAHRPASVVLRDYQGCLLPGADALGFDLWTRHTLLVKMLAVRVPESRLMPLRV